MGGLFFFTLVVYDIFWRCNLVGSGFLMTPQDDRATFAGGACFMTAGGIPIEISDGYLDIFGKVAVCVFVIKSGFSV